MSLSSWCAKWSRRHRLSLTLFAMAAVFALLAILFVIVFTQITSRWHDQQRDTLPAHCSLVDVHQFNTSSSGRQSPRQPQLMGSGGSGGSGGSADADQESIVSQTYSIWRVVQPDQLWTFIVTRAEGARSAADVHSSGHGSNVTCFFYFSDPRQLAFEEDELAAEAQFARDAGLAQTLIAVWTVSTVGAAGAGGLAYRRETQRGARRAHLGSASRGRGGSNRLLHAGADPEWLRWKTRIHQGTRDWRRPPAVVQPIVDLGIGSERDKADRGDKADKGDRKE